MHLFSVFKLCNVEFWKSFVFSLKALPSTFLSSETKEAWITSGAVFQLWAAVERQLLPGENEDVWQAKVTRGRWLYKASIAGPSEHCKVIKHFVITRYINPQQSSGIIFPLLRPSRSVWPVSLDFPPGAVSNPNGLCGNWWLPCGLLTGASAELRSRLRAACECHGCKTPAGGRWLPVFYEWSNNGLSGLTHSVRTQGETWGRKKMPLSCAGGADWIMGRKACQQLRERGCRRHRGNRCAARQRSCKLH